MKASSVDRAFALGKMEKRLGEFVPGVYEEEQTHPRPPEPVSEVNLDEWRIYQEEMEKRDVSAIRQQERKVLEEKRRQIDAEAKARHAKVGKIGPTQGWQCEGILNGANVVCYWITDILQAEIAEDKVDWDHPDIVTDTDTGEDITIF